MNIEARIVGRANFRNILQTFVLAADWRPNRREEYGVITCLAQHWSIQYTPGRY